ncbi:ABC transporter permease [Enterococcus hulanensis]|uniref:ABC transporter permease n=1 Tax=Enterococcus hulanensis TaxID=2559929 RepID=UPI00201701A0|nr:ABC transporter permease [Enterococcus hulanensis]
MISAEWMKLKRNRIFAVCSLLTLFASAFMVFKDLVIVESPIEDYRFWLPTVYLVVGALLSIMSGFIITFLLQREYEDRTINNVLTAPTSRLRFLLGKLAIWLIWYVGTLIGVVIIYTIGGWLIYPDTFGLTGTKSLVTTLLKYCLLAFVAAIPLLTVSVMQRKVFYPTIMIALAFTGIQMFAVNMPYKFARIIPWSAVVVQSLAELPFKDDLITLGSIFLTGIIGFVAAYWLFKKQDL